LWSEEERRSGRVGTCQVKISFSVLSVLEPMLDQYIGECMESIININNDAKEPTCGYQNCYLSRIVIFGGYVKVRESLYAQLLFGSVPF
jgi:hypothetical protein